MVVHCYYIKRVDTKIKISKINKIKELKRLDQFQPSKILETLCYQKLVKIIANLKKMKRH